MRTTYLDPENKTRIEVVDTPDSTGDGEERYDNGLHVASRSPAGIERERSYDAIERLASETDPRTGVTAYVYYTTGAGRIGKLASVTDPGNRTTVFHYDATSGRRNKVTDALSQDTHTAFDLHGRVVAVWGATYPVAYEFDGFAPRTAAADR